ncbi:hypothetical protein ABQJ54_11630 [Rhodanobacter sp. Si-c]|uniref:4-vinyl reductase 4VR domain-containing protein n=1 Tax=Rhodanobacter lycopersici TaxID=3162487 RepID=A0ABV3QEZ2_9GAMM
MGAQSDAPASHTGGLMVELEIQALALQREGLLIEVGRLAGSCGFTLVRQRLVQDPHGILLTMVVRGSWFRKRALRTALEGCERLTSFELGSFVEGESRPHFAATRKVASGYVPPPAPSPAPVAASTEEAVDECVAEAGADTAAPPAETVAEASSPESFEDFAPIQPRTPPPAPKPAEPVSAPFVEVAALEADVAAVEQALAALEHDYPRIVPRLLALACTVAAGARESTLQLAGQRVGAWLFAREYALDTGLDLDAALAAIGVPALHAFAEVDLQGRQLHIRHSPLCTEDGRSGCGFFSGMLEGLLGPAIAPGGLSTFPVCCSSCGADECVLAVSE